MSIKNKIAIEKQNGFTLIELVMVIVILGILGAIAVPKFVSLSQEARLATLKAARGNVATIASIVHTKAVIEGTDKLASSSVELEGVAIATAYGYPIYGNSLNSPIIVAAGLDNTLFRSNMTMNGTTYITLMVVSNGGQLFTTSSICAFSYTNATATSAAVTGGVPGSGFFSSQRCKN